MQTVHIFPTSCGVEVACTRRGRPSCRWVTGWTEIGANGYHSNPLPLREWQALARRDGFRLQAHRTEDACRAAVCD